VRAFSFVHASDLHLGYSQYGLEARRQDFDNAFQELVDKTIEQKKLMIIAVTFSSTTTIKRNP
jgi:DNA repair exonuclease SbcCD nuclease subunit